MSEPIFSDQQTNLSPKAILTKIDMIMQELEKLKAMVVTTQHGLEETDLVDKLFGVLGQGTWGEYKSE